MLTDILYVDSLLSCSRGLTEVLLLVLTEVLHFKLV